MASSVRVVALPEWNGSIAIHPRTALRDLLGCREPHARLGDGRTVVWKPDTPPVLDRIAIDAESLTTHVSAIVRERLDTFDHLGQLCEWTRLEVRTKLSGTPVLLLLRGIQDDSLIDLRTAVLNDIVLTLGTRRGSERSNRL